MPSPRVAPRTKAPPVVNQFHRQAVEFRFGRVDDLVGFELPLHPRIEGPDIILIGNRIETEHRFLVGDFDEFLQRWCADSLGGRVAGDQVGMGRFEVHELAKEPVVFRIGKSPAGLSCSRGDRDGGFDDEDRRSVVRLSDEAWAGYSRIN
jgi:hypothetical protein